MPLLNYTTTVAVDKTLGEIQAVLRQSGARSVLVDYDERGVPTSVAFKVITPLGEEAYQLPANLDGVFRTLTAQNARGAVPRRFVTRDQAARVGWRILKVWIEAQVAIISSGMVTLDQIMLPYAIVHDKITVYEAWRERQLALSDGSNRVGSEAQGRQLPSVRDV